MIEEKTHKTAALLLGAALSDLMPQGFLLKSGGVGPFFYYDIVLGESLPDVMLPHLENRMKEIQSKNPEIKIHEMVPSNAGEFFRHHRRFYPAHFVKQSKDPLVRVAQLDAFIDLAEGEYLKELGSLSSFRLNGVEKRPPLAYRKEQKQVYRVKGQCGDGVEVDPYALGEEMGLFEVQRYREDYLEKVHLRWRSKGEEVLHRLYLKWREVLLKEGFEIVSGGLLDTGASAEFFIEEGHRFDRVRLHCLEEELEGIKEKCEGIVERLSLVEPQETFLSVRKNQGFYRIEYSIFPSMEQMILEVLEDSEKDLSQKKELLAIVALCDE